MRGNAEFLTEEGRGNAHLVTGSHSVRRCSFVVRRWERLRADDTVCAEIGLQRLRDHDAAIGLLVILDDRDPGPSHGQAAAVQRMDELRSCPCRHLARIDARRA